MINESIQRSCQWEVVFQVFLLDVIFLELGSPRWRCNWNFGEVPAWSDLCSCLSSIQFCSSPCQGLRRSRMPGTEGLWAPLPACPEVCMGFKSQHIANLCSEHWGGTFSFPNAENSFRSAGHKVKYQLHGAHLLPRSKLWRWPLVKLMRLILWVLAELCSGWENKLILKTTKGVMQFPSFIRQSC